MASPFDSFAQYSDAGMHRRCFAEWPRRAAFIAYYNGRAAAFAQSGSVLHMDLDGHQHWRPRSAETTATSVIPTRNRALPMGCHERRPGVFVTFPTVRPSGQRQPRFVCVIVTPEPATAESRAALTAAIRVSRLDHFQTMMKTGGHGLVVDLLRHAPPDFENTPDAPGAGATYLEIMGADLVGGINHHVLSIPDLPRDAVVTCWLLFGGSCFVVPPMALDPTLGSAATASIMTPDALAFIATSDLAGLCRGKSIPLEALPARMDRGVGITHSNLMLSVFGPIHETPFGTTGDLMLVPDPATRTAIPMADGPDCALLLGDFRGTEGEPWECCPRDFLRRGIDALRAEGFDLLATFEQEMVYTGVADCPGSPYSLDALRRQGSFGGTLLAAMRAAGIAPDSFLAEYGPRQYEVTADPAAGLRAADDAIRVRELARAVAARLGHRAVLAPILHPDGIGNGTHIHWSLSDAANGAPATYDSTRLHNLSEPAEHFCAGLLHHMPAIVALTAPSAASYYRLRPNRWAPTMADLGVRDRGAAVRICPVYATAAETIARQFNVEFRVADAAASPYLALGALVHAGLDGLRQLRRLVDISPAPLPASLAEALDHLAASEAAAAWLGEALHRVYLQFKRAELRSLEGQDEAEICRRYAEVY